MLRTIKKFVISLGEKGAFDKWLYTVIKYSVASFLGAIWAEKRYAKWFYNLYTKRKLNLDTPRTFDEKLWWLKLNNRDPLLTICSDKYAVRQYVADCGFSEILIPQVDVLKSVGLIM